LETITKGRNDKKVCNPPATQTMPETKRYENIKLGKMKENGKKVTTTQKPKTHTTTALREWEGTQKRKERDLNEKREKTKP